VLGSTVSGATDDPFPVLIAGIAGGLAGIFSMAEGEYLIGAWEGTAPSRPAGRGRHARKAGGAHLEVEHAQPGGRAPRTLGSGGCCA